jgi:hypothetical protein
MIKKSFIAQVTIILFVAFLTPSMVNAQTTSHYGAKVGDSGGNLVGFDLTIYSPISQQTYSNTMPIHFKIDWIYGLLFYDNAKQFGLYAYQIDNNPPVSMPSNQKSNSSKDFISNPSFSTIIDISNLTDGQHQLVIIADMEWNPFGGGATSVCNQTSAPILFSVQNATPSPTPIPSVPELPATLAMSVLIISAISVALVLRRKTK